MKKKDLVVLLLLLLASVSAAAPKKPVRPSKTRIKPLALEYYLLAHFSKTKAGNEETLVERAKFLKKYAGSGYSIT